MPVGWWRCQACNAALRIGGHGGEVHLSDFGLGVLVHGTRDFGTCDRAALLGLLTSEPDRPLGAGCFNGALAEGVAVSMAEYKTRLDTDGSTQR